MLKSCWIDQKDSYKVPAIIEQHVVACSLYIQHDQKTDACEGIVFISAILQKCVVACSLYTRHGRKLKSQVRHNTTSPIWNEDFRFLVHVPGQQYLNGELKDWDRLSASDEIGRCN